MSDQPVSAAASVDAMTGAGLQRAWAEIVARRLAAVGLVVASPPEPPEPPEPEDTSVRESFADQEVSMYDTMRAWRDDRLGWDVITDRPDWRTIDELVSTYDARREAERVAYRPGQPREPGGRQPVLFICEDCGHAFRDSLPHDGDLHHYHDDDAHLRPGDRKTHTMRRTEDDGRALPVEDDMEHPHNTSVWIA